MSDRIKNIVTLASEMRDLENTIEELEATLKAKKEQFRRISATELPLLMGEIGLRQFKLSDGTSLLIKPILQVTLPVSDQPKVEIADQWLKDNGHDGLVKTNIDVSGVNEPQKIMEIKQALERLRVQYNIKKAIHPSTLRGWANEMERNGMVIPEGIFNVFRSFITVIE